MRRKNLIILALIGACLLAAPAAQAADSILLATTTSTDDTGLLDFLAPTILKATGVEMRWTSTGTGKALELGKNCDADLVLVHAPKAEQAFVEQGAGVNRRQVMFNDFVLIGPKDDPAGVKGLSVAAALAKLAEKQAVFVSRGDKSGTHMMELGLWKDANLAEPDKQAWYVAAGQGMLRTMAIAEEKKGYTLADRGTFFKYESDHHGHPPLVVLVEGDAKLRNQYSVIELPADRCPKVKAEAAKKVADWWVSPAGQAAIAGFKLHGKQLFIANADK
jgi:tungstate transport system substrate-binding protein